MTVEGSERRGILRCSRHFRNPATNVVCEHFIRGTFHQRVLGSPLVVRPRQRAETFSSWLGTTFSCSTSMTVGQTTGLCTRFPLSAPSNSLVIWVAVFVRCETRSCTSSAANGVVLPIGKHRPIAPHS